MIPRTEVKAPMVYSTAKRGLNSATSAERFVSVRKVHVQLGRMASGRISAGNRTPMPVCVGGWQAPPPSGKSGCQLGRSRSITSVLPRPNWFSARLASRLAERATAFRSERTRSRWSFALRLLRSSVVFGCWLLLWLRGTRPGISARSAVAEMLRVSMWTTRRLHVRPTRARSVFGVK